MSGLRADHCVIACAEAFRGDGAIVASPMGTIPRLGALLAKATFEPELLLSDGEADLLAEAVPLGAEADAPREGWLPFRQVFDVVAAGTRHVMMGASQLDRFGNQNISAIGDWSQPKVQLLGARGAPGNTANHTTSYWVPGHSPRVFVESVDFASGIGTDRARAAGSVVEGFHEIRVIVTDLGVLDLGGPEGTLRLRQVHPGITADEVAAATGCALHVPDVVPTSRPPNDEEAELLAWLDPDGLRLREVPEP